MTDNARKPKEPPTKEEVQKAEAKIRQLLDSLAVELSNRRELDQSPKGSTRDLKFWVNAYAPYSLVRSVKRQEALMKKMEKDSKRMTWLTVAVVVLTAVVAGPQLWPIISGSCEALFEISVR